MGRFFDTLLHRPVADARERALVARLEGVSDAATILDEMLAALVACPDPSEAVVARVASALDAVDDEARVAFWQALARRFPDHACIRVCQGDALVSAGREREAVHAFLAAFRIAPALIHDVDAVAELACAQGGAVWLEYQLIELSAILDAAEAQDDGDTDIDVRERYSELLEEHHGDRAAMARIRELGERIRALEAAGVLPQALVRRGDWRHD